MPIRKRKFTDIKSFKLEGHTFKRSKYKNGGWILLGPDSKEPLKMDRTLIQVFEYFPGGRMRIGDLVGLVTDGPIRLDDLIGESAEAVSKAILMSAMMTFGHLSKSKKDGDFVKGLNAEIAELNKLSVLTKNARVVDGIKSLIDTLEDLKNVV